jgi:preprotein translocase SecE subunit
MADALKMKEEGIRGGGGGGNSVTTALGNLGEYPRRLRQYLHEVRIEMKAVNWPSRSDVWSTTIVVAVTVAFFGVYFLLTDATAQRAVSLLINYGKHH